MYIVQPKYQGQLQLLSPPFLMTSTTKQMRPNGKWGGMEAGVFRHIIFIGASCVVQWCQYCDQFVMVYMCVCVYVAGCPGGLSLNPQ